MFGVVNVKRIEGRISMKSSRVMQRGRICYKGVEIIEYMIERIVFGENVFSDLQEHYLKNNKRKERL